MKVSVSLPQEDVDFLDEYAQDQGIGSRSAVLHTAIRLLRASGLSGAYEEAWQEWDSEGAEAAWDEAVADGLSS
jgi:Arc/MetJ-type ribon-helix-helix transcriptional regulator